MIHPCIKCSRPLRPSGTIKLGAASLKSYECPECYIESHEFGEPIEIPLVFAVDAAGAVIDPGTGAVFKLPPSQSPPSASA